MYYKKIESSDNSDWLVLLHGFCGNSGMWEKQVNYFKDRYNLLLIDLPGHGKSVDGLSELGIQSFKELGSDIAKVIKEEGIEKADFIGASLGSMVIGGILQYNPECVNKVILGDAVIVANPISRFILKIVDKIQYFIPYQLVLYVGNFILMPFPYITNFVVPKFYFKSGSKLVQREFNIWFSLIIKELHILESIEYTKKTLFISGVRDLHLKKGVKRVSESHKNTKLEIIKGIGHVCNMQDEMGFNKVVSRFLETGEVLKKEGELQEVKKKESVNLNYEVI